MSSVPFVPPAFRASCRPPATCSSSARPASSRPPGGRVADIGDVVGRAFAADPAMFSADRFHPSTAGYARIAEALIPHVVQAAVARRDGETAA